MSDHRPGRPQVNEVLSEAWIARLRAAATLTVADASAPPALEALSPGAVPRDAVGATVAVAGRNFLPGRAGALLCFGGRLLWWGW